jgi:hypothetical protein
MQKKFIPAVKSRQDGHHDRMKKANRNFNFPLIAGCICVQMPQRIVFLPTGRLCSCQ